MTKQESINDMEIREFKAKIAKFKKEKTKEELLYLAEKKASLIDILDRLAARKVLDARGIKYSLANI